MGLIDGAVGGNLQSRLSPAAEDGNITILTDTLAFFAHLEITDGFPPRFALRFGGKWHVTFRSVQPTSYYDDSRLIIAREEVESPGGQNGQFITSADEH